MDARGTMQGSLKNRKTKIRKETTTTDNKITKRYNHFLEFPFTLQMFYSNLLWSATYNKIGTERLA